MNSCALCRRYSLYGWRININECNQCRPCSTVKPLNGFKSNYVCSFDRLISRTGCNEFKFTCEPFCSCDTFSRSSRESVCSRWESEVMAGRRKSQSGRVCTCRDPRTHDVSRVRKALQPLYPLSWFNSLSSIKQSAFWKGNFLVKWKIYWLKRQKRFYVIAFWVSNLCAT